MAKATEEERRVLYNSGFIHVTRLKAVLSDGTRYVIIPNSRLGIWDCDEKNNVLVVVTSSREVWIKTSPSDIIMQMPDEVIQTLGLFRYHFGVEGMFENIDPDQFASRVGNPDWEPGDVVRSLFGWSSFD